MGTALELFALYSPSSCIRLLADTETDQLRESLLLLPYRHHGRLREHRKAIRRILLQAVRQRPLRSCQPLWQRLHAHIRGCAMPGCSEHYPEVSGPPIQASPAPSLHPRRPAQQRKRRYPCYRHRRTACGGGEEADELLADVPADAERRQLLRLQRHFPSGVPGCLEEDTLEVGDDTFYTIARGRRGMKTLEIDY